MTEISVTFIDNPHAPVVYSTDATGFLRSGGNVIITFETAVVDHSTSPGPVNRVVAGRVVMPIEAAQRFVLGLHDYLGNIGFNPTEAAKAGAAAQ